MGDYTHLSMQERCLLNTLLEMKFDVDAIAKRMGRHRSTIYRELERNIYYGYYMPAIADAQRGLADGQYKLVKCYAKGIGVARDKQKAGL